MTVKRSLSLKREALAELTAADLGSVVAGAPMSGVACVSQDGGSVCNLTVQPRCW